MRASRLIRILLLLQTRGTATAEQLADELEVSVRTVYRDLADLGAAGVPVYGERADFKEWQRVVPSPCRVSINLSLRQLQQQKFLEGFRRTFRQHGVSPTCFELEITETTLMHDIGRTIRILDSLYGMGLHLAIDDFGTGYSSLSALRQFPIGVLKIDQSFIRDLRVDKDNAAIVRTIIQMGKSLNLDVVAEGVETEEQLDFLRIFGCDIVQGHLFGDAMSADDFRDLLIADAEGSGRYQALFA